MVTLEAAAAMWQAAKLVEVSPADYDTDSNCQRVLSAAITNKLQTRCKRYTQLLLRYRYSAERYTDTHSAGAATQKIQNTSAKTEGRQRPQRLERAEEKENRGECAQYNAQCTNDKYAQQKRDSNATTTRLTERVPGQQQQQ